MSIQSVRAAPGTRALRRPLAALKCSRRERNLQHRRTNGRTDERTNEPPFAPSSVLPCFMIYSLARSRSASPSLSRAPRSRLETGSNGLEWVSLRPRPPRPFVRRNYIGLSNTSLLLLLLLYANARARTIDHDPTDRESATTRLPRSIREMECRFVLFSFYSHFYRFFDANELYRDWL